MTPWSVSPAPWVARAACAALLAGGGARVPAGEPSSAAVTLCPSEAEASRGARTSADGGAAAPERAGGAGEAGHLRPVRLTPEQAERLREAARKRTAELRTKRPTPDPGAPKE